MSPLTYTGTYQSLKFTRIHTHSLSPPPLLLSFALQVTSSPPALGLACEAAEEDVMQRDPVEPGRCVCVCVSTGEGWAIVITKYLCLWCIVVWVCAWVLAYSEEI